MSGTASTNIVLEAFEAVERRDERRLAQLYHPEVEFHWPPSLPSGGSWRSIAGLRIRPEQPGTRSGILCSRPGKSGGWTSWPVAATGQEVVVLWHQRGLKPAGQRLDMEALGLYEVRDGKFERLHVQPLDGWLEPSLMPQ